MNRIAHLLSPDYVIASLDASSKKRVFEDAGILFENQQGIARSVVFDALFAREKLGSTGLGQGIAIPHGRIKGLREATGAFFKLKTPISFDAHDSQPVSMLFILLVPEQATDLHLQILGELAQMFSNRQLREKLRASDNPAEIHQLLTA